MLRIGEVELGSIPRIAAVFSDAEIRAGADAARRHADLIELRIDRFTRLDATSVLDVCREARSSAMPVIATVRASYEGGEASLDEAARLALYEAVIPTVDAVDIELESEIREPVLSAARARRKPVIVSHHDFERTPSDGEIHGRIERGAATGADVVKVATMAREPADVDRLLGILRAHRARNLILIAMGAEGVASRVFFPLFGSLLTYACVEGAVAPGQLALADLDRELRLYSPALARERSRRG